jgi:soluble lytic murein transglycosylase-like protein
MQLMPGTQRDLGVADPYDPEQAIRAGARYLRSLLDTFKILPLALAAYNAGPDVVKEYGRVPPFPETQDYVRRVLDRYAYLKGW